MKYSKFSILRLPEVIELTGLSRSTIYAYMADGIFPNHIKIGAHAVGWVYMDIEQWIKKRIVNSRAQAAIKQEKVE